MTKIIITPERDQGHSYGYTLRHNQPVGFLGAYGHTFAWYRYKRDALARAEELMQSLNNPQNS